MATLPPGQRESQTFHRFGISRFANRFPAQTDTCSLRVAGDVGRTLTLADALRGLPRTDQVSDFHCVTTWSVRGLRWGGVRFADLWSHVVLPEAHPDEEATLIALRGQDGAYTAMLLEDLLAPDVLLADQLNGEALPVEHGGPLRLVAPAHYGYKSVKYLCELQLRRPGADYRVSAFRFMDHPRARVALEERGRGVPGRILRYLYRPLIGPTVRRFRRALDRHDANDHMA